MKSIYRAAGLENKTCAASTPFRLKTVIGYDENPHPDFVKMLERALHPCIGRSPSEERPAESTE